MRHGFAAVRQQLNDWQVPHAVFQTPLRGLSVLKPLMGRPHRGGGHILRAQHYRLVLPTHLPFQRHLHTTSRRQSGGDGLGWFVRGGSTYLFQQTPIEWEYLVAGGERIAEVDGGIASVTETGSIVPAEYGGDGVCADHAEGAR